jgi:hypothetical protein
LTNSGLYLGVSKVCFFSTVGSSLKDAFRILLDKIGFYPK